MGKVYLKMVDFLEKVASWAILSFLSVMVLVVFFNVVGRYFIGHSIAWAEEIARFMLLWMAFLGGIIAYKYDEHLGLDIIYTIIPKKVGYSLLIIVYLLVMFVLYKFTVGAYQIAVDMWSWHAPASGISYGHVNMIMPVCTSIMILQTVGKIVKNTLRLIKHDYEEQVIHYKEL